MEPSRQAKRIFTTKWSIPPWVLFAVSFIPERWWAKLWGLVGDAFLIGDILGLLPEGWRPELTTVQFIGILVAIAWLTAIAFWPGRTPHPQKELDTGGCPDVFLEWDLPEEGKKFSGLGLDRQIIACNYSDSQHVYNVELAPFRLSETLTFKSIDRLAPKQRLPVEPVLPRAAYKPLDNFFTYPANEKIARQRGLISDIPTGLAPFKYSMPVTLMFVTNERRCESTGIFEWDGWDKGRFIRSLRQDTVLPEKRPIVVPVRYGGGKSKSTHGYYGLAVRNDGEPAYQVAAATRVDLPGIGHLDLYVTPGDLRKSDKEMFFPLFVKTSTISSFGSRMYDFMVEHDLDSVTIPIRYRGANEEEWYETDAIVIKDQMARSTDDSETGLRFDWRQRRIPPPSTQR